MSTLTNLALTLLPFLLVGAIFAVLIPKARRAKATGRPWSLLTAFTYMGIGILLVALVIYLAGQATS